jgi:rhodanese-related sulfurtransferase
VAESHLTEVKHLRQEFAVEGLEDELARDALEELLNSESAVLIDVRPAIEFEHGHLPGAMSIPAEELPRRVDELPRQKRIVAYCRGSYCLFADEAAHSSEKGHDAIRPMVAGWWLAEGADFSHVRLTSVITEWQRKDASTSPGSARPSANLKKHAHSNAKRVKS